MQPLPDWFLVLSLFLPRIALIAAYFTDGAFPHLFTKWLSVPMAIFIPRILILIAIYNGMGFHTWFWIHLVVTLVIWTASLLHQKKNR
mgnify:CR=1 FL=1